MTKDTYSKKNSEEQNKQYDRAISLIQYHVQLMWLIYGAFLLAETVLLGAIAQIASNQKALAIGGAFLGALLTIPWKRGKGVSPCIVAFPVVTGLMPQQNASGKSAGFFALIFEMGPEISRFR
jgi:hypothetical protein